MKNCSLYLFLFVTIATITCTTSAAQELPSAYINVSGTKVYVEGGGSNKNLPILFVHAGFQDHTMWDAQAKDFMKDHVVIMLDLPGHGKTKDGPKPPMATEVLLAVMDSLQLNKASLIGLSFGGAVATDFAVAHPERVNKLILASSGLTGWDEGRQLDTATKQFLHELTTAFVSKDTSAAAEVFTHYWFDGLQRSEKTVSPLLRNFVYTTTKNTMRQHHATTAWPTFATPSAINKLPEIKVPTLILTGTLDLPEILLTNGYMVNNMPNVYQVMISGAAHFINMEKPERFNQEVRKFLSEK